LTECFNDFLQFLSFGSHRQKFVRALRQFRGPLRQLLLMLRNLALQHVILSLQCVILSPQVGNFILHISSLTIEYVPPGWRLAKVCGRRRPLRIALRRRQCASTDQLFKLCVLLFQIDQHVLECITRGLSFLSLCGVRGNRTLHLKLQLLFELRNQALQFTVECGVLLLQISGLWPWCVSRRLLLPRVRGWRFPRLALLKQLPDLCD
jgi:hypothetical protein